MIFGLFFDDFSMIFESFPSKEKINKKKPRKPSKNHEKIIKKTSFCLKKQRKLAKILDFHGFSSKTMKIIKKSSKNDRFA